MIGRDEEEMKNFKGARQQTGFEKVSQKKHRRSRKPKFELIKPKKVYDNKKKDKKKNQMEITQIAKLGLEEFPIMFSEIRERNRLLEELNSKINRYILDKLSTWDAEDK
ncbi:uncharacterized protein LOC111300247 [Durio zibethinus]|uniref:Uncharacterized protein LOC111300245 n=1 Tax=Durio zibethinus TaxID=66656 RepID=A0A6P5ZGZ4_DURZI|nr:uncharacterized protein LOC111300245 [Durio zibethinus]XP_022751617.1 uncharacterized protein LOC111300247 [Durio zibethinus]